MHAYTQARRCAQGVHKGLNVHRNTLLHAHEHPLKRTGILTDTHKYIYNPDSATRVTNPTPLSHTQRHRTDRQIDTHTHATNH